MPDAERQRPRAWWLYAAGLVLVVAAILGALAMFSRQKAQVEAATQHLVTETEKGPNVEVATARRVNGADTLRLLGESHAYQTAVVYAKVSGYLRSISVDKGDFVRQNQVMAVIESPETDKQYQAAVADAHNKQLIADRAATLVKKQMISQQDTDQAEADAQVSKANLEQLGVLKSYEQLKAPFTGTVTARYADPGALIQNATAAQTSALPVVEVSETTRLRIYVYVDQAHAAFVKVGDTVTIVDPARAGSKLTAHVTRTSGQIDSKTRTLLVEIDVENPNKRILAGSFVQVELKVQTPPYLEVPADALVVRGGQTLVALVTPESRVKFTPVVVADQTGETAHLLAGINEGDRVARNLGERVADGSRVQVVSPQSN